MNLTEPINLNPPSSTVKNQRGRPARITRLDVLEAGLELIKTTGIDNLTMRTMAQKLNVAPMSLYSHVKDKDDLMVGIAQMLFERLHFNVDKSSHWEQQITTWMNDVRQQLREFPQLPQLYTYNEQYSASLLNTTVVAVDILKQAGLHCDAKMLLTARALMWFVLGHTTLESFVKPRTQQANMDLLFAQLANLPEEQRRTLEPLKPFFIERDIDELFEFGASLMITGIKHQLINGTANSG